MFSVPGVVFSNGERWRQLRRFTLSTLRNFGMGKRSIEERIQEEAQCLVQELHKTHGMPFDPIFILSRAVSNVICSIVFGNRFDYDDVQFLQLNKLITKRFRVSSSPQATLYNMFPEFLEKLPGVHHAASKCSQKIISFIVERIKMQEASRDPSAPQNFIDCFLAKIEQEKHDPNTEFTMENLIMNTFNIFFAGTETVSTTLRYGFLLLLKHPEIQEKVHEEIDRVIGQDRIPNAEDRNKMPYTDAVLHEIQRFSDPFKWKNTRLDQLVGGKDGLREPKDYVSQSTSPSISTGSTAFGFSLAGKRVCLGEGLARMELFLFLTTILQSFALTSPVPLSELNLAPAVSATSRMPTKYQLLMVPR
ncbi:hypothetical protein JD844_005849 [Phrynosoma platyrhinos]|uniref:Uncharacterized protein n=1 Tax=Phrynosoma platyrhinos TaxID=52577 RepID=A0ABQ7TPY9_PHRPL|nr:hypothetical protein JD844_005849 [Phrynosoma platyrhinos]